MNLVRLSLISIFGCSFAFSAAYAGEAKCVFTDLLASEKCPVYSTARALEFLGMGDDAVIFIESEKTAPEKLQPEKLQPDAKQDAKAGAKKSDAKSDSPTVRERTSVVASSRVEDSVLMDEIDEDEGMLLEREVQELSGARYELPRSRREIKKQLGFPETAEIANEDWIEMIRVHAETVLSISAVASRFLLEQVGLAATAPSALADDAAVFSSAATASVLSEPREPFLFKGESNPVVVETH